jgi:hypothetical protein
VLISAGIIYIDRYGQAPLLEAGVVRKKISETFAVNPHRDLTNRLLTNISLLKSFRAEGEIDGDLKSFFIGLKEFRSKNNLAVTLVDVKSLKLDWLSDVVFKSLANQDYSLSFELKRSNPTEFYIRTSKAKIDLVIKSLLEPLLEKWVLASSEIIKQLAPPEEQLNLGFNEEQFISEIRKTIQQAPVISLIRKLSGENHYQFVVPPVELTQFLGLLIGNLSGQPFSEEEFINLFQILYQYQISGEVWIDPVKNLPTELVVGWNKWLTLHLRLKDFDELINIDNPPKAEKLEDLLK